MSAEVCSSYPHDDDDGIELELGLSIGGGLKLKEEISSRVILNDNKGFPSCSSSSSSSVNIPNSVVGWPPIRRAHKNPILGSRQVNNNRILNSYLSVKVNMEGTLIGRKVDLNAHSSYDMLAQTLEDMFHGSLGSSRLLNGASEFLLTYEDKDGDCMLVGDVPWKMFLSSVKRLRILRNPKSIGPNKKS